MGINYYEYWIIEDDNIDDDPIERELDVYISQTLSNQLYYKYLH